MRIGTLELPDHIAERLNACMRPSDSIRQKKLAIVLALLREFDTLESDDLRLAALMHVFDAYGFAYFSGPQTPAEALLNPPAAGSSEERAFMEAINDTDQRAFAFAAAQLFAGIDPVSAVGKDGGNVVVSRNSGDAVNHKLACACYALHRLQEETTQERRAGFLSLMLSSRMFCPQSQPPASPWSDPTVDEAYYRDALRRHEITIHRALWCLHVVRMVADPEAGGALLDVLSRVTDPRDRACILGFVIEQWKDRSIGKLLKMRGEPIPIDPRLNPTIDETYYNGALWRNRTVAREAFWCLPGVGSFNTKAPQVGGTILDVLARVTDPRDRACVLWFVIEQWRDRSATELAGRQGVPISVDRIPTTPTKDRDRSIN
ncbi:MAG: hypothetical protein Q7R80_03445 [bacterium]|nr:hypothetical protein [bacterium]